MEEKEKEEERIRDRTSGEAWGPQKGERSRESDSIQGKKIY